jgi:hypothetical protein
VATPAELKKARLPKGCVGFAVTVPYDGVTKRRQRGEIELVAFEAGDSLADARETLVAIGFEPDAVASLSPNLAPTTKARHGVRHPETGQFRAKRTGLWEHSGGVLPALLSHK